ncbi:MAG: bifunctional DNA-formamidopyrimidine glycosylase/DNA-(apurinic or apyrimidinic site) lyase [Candidatus Andersenbacteria bacterium]|nr:bifunctional DNA-formamidopyrimidine glycosylase/DNA-(apurinic or apyrimidinic site) lyase [Candidatus Andersenbacteria bacterium]
MPELPEVETIRRDLARVLKGRRVERVSVRTAKLVRPPSLKLRGTSGGGAGSFMRKLRGRVVRGVRRRGKLLIFVLDAPDLFLLIHLKMTGQLIFRGKRQYVGGGHGYPLLRPGSEGPDDLPGKYTHITFTFTDGTALYFNDMRQFGYVRVVGDEERRRVEGTFGIEPLSKTFTAEALRERLRGRQAALKSVLLEQRTVAGLGNIYVDEACYAARISPTRRADSLSHAEIHALRAGIQRVLRQALRWRGTTFGSYRDGLGGKGKFVSRLRVYGRGGEPCRLCRSVLRRVTVGGRGTTFCPVCQR